MALVAKSYRVLPGRAHSAGADGRYDGRRVSRCRESPPQADVRHPKQSCRFWYRITLDIQGYVRYCCEKCWKTLPPGYSRLSPQIQVPSEHELTHHVHWTRNWAQ